MREVCQQQIAVVLFSDSPYSPLKDANIQQVRSVCVCYIMDEKSEEEDLGTQSLPAGMGFFNRIYSVKIDRNRTQCFLHIINSVAFLLEG